MRVTYHRELKMKECFDKMNIETFIPMHYEQTEDAQGQSRRLVPAINNLIFVHSTQEMLTSLKMTRSELEPLRYMMRPGQEGRRPEIIHVPDRQMMNFMRVATVTDDRVLFLKYDSYLKKVGQRVMVTGGFFNGVEGVIKRIANNKRVVVTIDGVAAVAIANVPVEYLAPMNEQNY